jgi:MTH538 TIR-like domain (DUF1863)
MARHVFFSFHYDRDIWRVNQVRNASMFVGADVAGYFDRSLWENAQKQGDAGIRRMIDNALWGTSVTAVLIGRETATRTYVDYEIEQSIARGNGIFGIRIHHLQDQFGQTDYEGAVPWRMAGYPVYTWANRPTDLGIWIEQAFQASH